MIPKKLVLELAKGFRGRSKNCISIARERVEKALQYAYRSVNRINECMNISTMVSLDLRPFCFTYFSSPFVSSEIAACAEGTCDRNGSNRSTLVRSPPKFFVPFLFRFGLD